MIEQIRGFFKDTRGDAVTWTVIIIIGVIIGVTMYMHVKGSPGGLGEGITSAGSNAATGISGVSVQ